MSSKRNLPRGVGMMPAANSMQAIDRAGFGGDHQSLNETLEKAIEQQMELKSGTLRVGKFTLSPIGLEVDGTPSEEHWVTVGQFLQRMNSSIQWLVGDWINYGERVWGKTYAEISQLTGYEESTLQQFAWIARSVQFSVRTENLSYGHHQLVASLKLPNKEPDIKAQQQWLARAVDNGWSVSTLRKEILGVKREPSEDIFADMLVQLEIRIEKHIDKLVKDGKKEDARALITEMQSWVDGLERRLPPR
jgi:hypothetical protein